jgi:uncharacterized membrane protein YvbJ
MFIKILAGAMTAAILIFVITVIIIAYRISKTFKQIKTDPKKRKEVMDRLNTKQVNSLLNPSGKGCCGGNKDA